MTMAKLECLSIRSDLVLTTAPLLLVHRIVPATEDQGYHHEEEFDIFESRTFLQEQRVQKA